jgi:hypothetical protein
LKLALSALSALLLAWTPACFAQVHATITMRDPSALEVSYEITPSCTGLAFANDGMRPQTVTELRKDWRADDDCTVFDANGIKPARASCTTLRVRVPASDRVLDRIYPWADPVGDGLYVHTADYALTGACGPVEWTFAAPGGTVVMDGVVSASRAMRAANQGGDAMPVVLLKQPLQPGAARVHADARFGSQTMTMVVDSARAAEVQLKQDLPGVDFTMPYIVAAVAPRGYFHGDMANRTIMRLAFQDEPGPAQDDVLHSYVPHEMSHMTQVMDWNDSWGAEQPLFAEGGAELLRVTTATHLGWYDVARMQAELQTAVNGCAIAAGGKSWKSIPGRGWGKVPYNCGLTFYLLALSANPGPDAPLLRVRDYYRQARAGQRTDFAQALECGARAGCQPRWLTRLAGAEPLDSVLLDATREPNALLHVVADKWSPDMVTTLARRHMIQLMQADCQGVADMAFEEGAVRINDEPRCATLRKDMTVAAVEGLPLFGDGAALHASMRACRKTGKTTLGLKDGASVTVSCGQAVGLPPHLYAVDAARAQALLRTPLTSTMSN